VILFSLIDGAFVALFAFIHTFPLGSQSYSFKVNNNEQFSSVPGLDGPK
jgi:hypothetical protein